MEFRTDLSVKDYLKEYFGFSDFKGLQESIIKNLLSGENTFVLMPTGAGKSLCYQLPAIINEGTAIIVSPLIALMKNQVDSIRALSEKEGIAEFLNSSLNKGDIARVKQYVLEGRTKMLYVAPESLAKKENLEFLKQANISFVAVDEAHCISEWGHDFRPEYRNIRKMTEELGDIPIIALTATATEKVQADILKNLKMSDANVFKSSFNRANLYYEIQPKINAEKQIIKYIKQNLGKSGIVYCLSRKTAEEIAKLLAANGIKAKPYHAGLDASTRSRHQDMFLMEETDVIVATIAFGMGIDKPDVRFVIHYDMPKSIESYYQETGRAGRDGLEGNCIAFFRHKDIEKLKKFNKNKGVAEREIGDLLLAEVVNYAESSLCRRKLILHYFGEEYDESACSGMCDACKYEKEKLEIKDELQALLQVVDYLGNQFNSNHIISFIVGDETESITRFNHHNKEHFGIGSEKGNEFWNALLKYGVIYGHLRKEIEKYGVLHLTEKGRNYLSSPYAVKVPPDNDFSKASGVRKSGSGRTAASDPVLYKMLLDLRREIAQSKSLPPYIIFQEYSLEEMATRYPINNDELVSINGVSPGKSRKFGKPFLELISQYVEENEIERPDDLVIKTTSKNRSLRAALIAGIDRKTPIEDLAQTTNSSVDEVLENLYEIVNSGTKINIDYEINDYLDEDMKDELYDYFLESKTDGIDEAYEEFEEEYSHEELMLVRIKFTSEQAH